jgi:hypothetical protein
VGAVAIRYPIPTKHVSRRRGSACRRDSARFMHKPEFDGVSVLRSSLTPWCLLFNWVTDPAYRGRLPVQLFHGQCGDEMMLLCGLATKNTPVFSWSTSPSLQIGGNTPQHAEFESRTHVEPVERIHIGIQGTGPHSAIPSYCETQSFSGSDESRVIAASTMTSTFRERTRTPRPVPVLGLSCVWSSRFSNSGPRRTVSVLE